MIDRTVESARDVEELAHLLEFLARKVREQPPRSYTSRGTLVELDAIVRGQRYRMQTREFEDVEVTIRWKE